MKFRILIPAMAVLWVWGFSVLSPSGPTWAAQSLLLGDKHKDRGMDCSGCHKESPPKQDIPMAGEDYLHTLIKKEGGNHDDKT